jgi:hypothetical protein
VSSLIPPLSGAPGLHRVSDREVGHLISVANLLFPVDIDALEAILRQESFQRRDEPRTSSSSAGEVAESSPCRARIVEVPSTYSNPRLQRGGL